MKSRTLLLAAMFMLGSQAVHAAEKLLTIGGAVTEIVYALGKGDEVIANDLTSAYIGRLYVSTAVAAVPFR